MKFEVSLSEEDIKALEKEEIGVALPGWREYEEDFPIAKKILRDIFVQYYRWERSKDNL